jgi:quercetin dioxygenase-like cupin family protein
MVVIRNWRDQTPTVSHESAIIWELFRGPGYDDKTEDEAPMKAIKGFTMHALQGRKNSDYHDHDAAEQVYYITKGRGQMKIDEKLYDVVEGDAVYIPPRAKHQLINDSDEWIEHLIITAEVGG